MFKHIFWDMGGTMFDTYPQVDAMLAGVVRAAGFEIDDLEVAQLTRRSTRTAIIELAARFSIPPDVFRAAESELKQQWRATPPPPMPGLQEVLAAVHARTPTGKNLVVTHRDRRSATALLHSRDIEEVDDLICPGDGFPRKPDPTMFQVLIARYGLDPAQCLGVGDRPLDVEAAHAAGLSAAMVVTPELQLEPGAADFVIPDLRDLLKILG